MRKFLIFLMLIFLWLNPLCLRAAPPLYFISYDLGPLYTNLGTTQSLNLLNNLGNTYIATRCWQNNGGTFMFGIGKQWYNNIKLHLTINSSLRYLQTSDIAFGGNVWQLHSAQLNNLSYNYQTKTQLFLFDNLISWTQHSFQPGLIVGVGLSTNSAYNYHETPLNNRAAGMLQPFSNNSTTKFAYDLGLALDYQLKGAVLELAYRFIDAGDAHLGVTPLQNTPDRLGTGNLYYNYISFGGRFYYAL